MVSAESSPSNALVTVILPCFNAEKTVQESIRSVFAQTFSRWHLVVVDDGSTDSTLRAIMEVTKDEANRTTVLSTTNGGACRARNFGIALVKSQFVAFIDADDVWHPDKLDLQIKFLEKNPGIGGVTCGFSTGKKLPQRVRNFGWTRYELESWALLGPHAPAIGSTLLVRARLLEKSGGYDEQLVSHSEDVDLAWRLLRHGQIATIKSCLVCLGSEPNGLHLDYESMAKSCHAFYRKLAGSDRRLANRGQKYLRIYLGLKRFLRGNELGVRWDGFTTLIRNPIGLARYTSFRLVRLLGSR